MDELYVDEGLEISAHADAQVPKATPDEAHTQTNAGPAAEGSAAAAAEARSAVQDDIFELLELAECDLPVVWPKGWDIGRARRFKLGIA